MDWLFFITETGRVYCAVRSAFYVLPTQCVYVFSVDLRTNSDYFTVQHWLVGFYNWDGVCLLRGTFYILRSPHTSIYVFCVDLRRNSDYFTVQHWLVGFYNWDGECLLRGTFYILRSAHTICLCVLCGSEKKQRLFYWTALTDRLVFITETVCLLRGTDCVFKPNPGQKNQTYKFHGPYFFNTYHNSYVFIYTLFS